MTYLSVVGHYWYCIIGFVLLVAAAIAIVEYFHDWTKLLNKLKDFSNTHFHTSFQEKLTFKSPTNTLSWTFKTFVKWLVILFIVMNVVLVAVFRF